MSVDFRAAAMAGEYLPQAALLVRFIVTMDAEHPQDDLPDLVVAENLPWFLEQRDAIRRQIAPRRVNLPPIVDGSGPDQVTRFGLDGPELGAWIVTMVRRPGLNDLRGLDFDHWRISHVGDPYQPGDLTNWDHPSNSERA